MKRKVGACLGSLFKHYDTALFGFLSPFLAPILFPDQDRVTALILTYSILPLGMIARMLGSFFLARSLFHSLTGMAVVSGAIACMPMTPAFFFLGRLLQNFLAGGGNGAIYLLEKSEEKKHDLLSGIYGAMTVGGYLLASWAVYYFGHDHWRWLYLFGCITALFGCLFRGEKKVREKWSLWEYRKPLLLIILASGFASSCYYISLVLMNGFIPLVSTHSKLAMIEINSYLLIFDFFALPFFGWLASKISREKLMLFASIGVVLFALPLLGFLDQANLTTVIGIRVLLVTAGVAFSAPFSAWAQSLVPPEHRYSVVSFGYSVGSQLLGSGTAAISLWIYHQTGMVSSVGWYWVLLAALAVFAIDRRVTVKYNPTP